MALASWQNASLENYMLCTHGIEGKHWKYGDNGSVVNLMSDPPNQEYSGVRSTAWAAKWVSQVRLLPPPPDEPPADPLVIPRISKCYNTRAQANVPEQGEYPSMPVVDRWCPYMFPKSVDKQGDMDTVFNELHAQIINGEIGVTEGVKAFWDRWYAAGGEIRVQEIKEQWQAFSAAHPEWKDPKATFAPETWNTQISYPERRKP